MRVLCRVVGWLVVVLTLAGCGREKSQALPPQPTGPLKVTLQLDDVPRVEVAGFYQALAKGFYQRAGLEVEIRGGTPETDVAAMVGQGEADFGLGRSDDAMLKASAGLPLEMVAATRQHDPLALLVHAKSPVRKLANLKGRTVFAKPGQGWISYVQKQQRLTLVMKPPTSGLEAFLVDSDAIMAGYVTSDVAEARQRRTDVRTIPLSDGRYDPYEVIFCRGSYARQNPLVVRAFIQATLLGWSDFLENDPTPAYDLLQKRNALLTMDVLDYARGELIIGQWITGDATKGEYLGDLSLDRLGRELDLLLELGVMTDPIMLKDVVTRDYLIRSLP